MTADLCDTIIEQRDRAADKAFRSLARYKFWMFGYHASAWVKFNQLLPVPIRVRNPFRALVLAARNHIIATEG